MLEKRRRKLIGIEDRKRPDSIEQLIRMYDLDCIWDYIDKIIDEVNKKGG